VTEAVRGAGTEAVKWAGTGGVREAVAEHPTFFGPDDESLFGTLHLPASGRIRGAVVICPPLAKEHFDTVRGLRLLADEFASRGLAALRFDYYGTGDSASWSERDDIVSRWLDSVGRAVAYLRDLAPGDPAVVALRAGTLVATAALPAIGPVGPVVLWDPIGRGQAFLREQVALYTMTVGAEQAPSAAADPVPLIGTTLTRSACDDLKALRLTPDVLPLAPRWLLVTRPGAADKAVETFAAEESVERVRVEGMPEFVQATDYLVRLPISAIDQIVRWVDEALPRIPASPVTPTVRAVAHHTTPSGTRVTEAVERLGPHRLFAMRTRPTDAPAQRTVLLLATANDTHHGPNRAWVDISRGIAANGAQAIRFDRRGAGETGPVTVGEAPRPYTAAAVDDALAAGRASGPPDRLLVAGVCSGAWHSAQVGRRLKPDAVVLINAILWSWRHKTNLTWGGSNADSLGGVPRDDPAFVRSPLGRAKAFIQRWLPYPGWRLLGHAGLTQVPEVLLRPLVRRHVDVTVVLSPHDADWFDGQRGEEGLHRLSPPVRVLRTGIGDHTAYHPAVRATVADAVLDWCTRTDVELREECTR
jgi:alpha-beta hydrolase superfamily lysophospholipase